MELQQVKDYLRVDYEEEDALISAMHLAAREYLKNAGVPEQPSSELYNHVIFMLTAIFYDNRGTTDKDIAIPSFLHHLIIQLSMKVNA